MTHIKYNASQIADKILTKNGLLGDANFSPERYNILREEIISLALSSWEQGQDDIIKKIKDIFKEDGISIVLDRTDYRLMIAENIPTPEPLFFYEK